MLNTPTKSLSSDIYATIAASRMSGLDRSIALAALRDADTITDVILSVATFLRGLTTHSGHGSLTHSH